MGDDADSDLEEIPELSTSPNGQRHDQQSAAGISEVGAEDDRRAHHNALERKRRDYIKDSFSSLKEVVPTLKGEKASRALILKKGAEYINSMKGRINDHNKDIMEMKRQNSLLEAQVKIIESRLETTGNIRPACFTSAAEASPAINQHIPMVHQDIGSPSTNQDSEEPELKRIKSSPGH